MLFITCGRCGVSLRLEIPKSVVDEKSLKEFMENLSENGCPLCQSITGELYISSVPDSQLSFVKKEVVPNDDVMQELWDCMLWVD